MLITTPGTSRSRSRRSASLWSLTPRAAAWIAGAAMVVAAGCGDVPDVNVVLQQLAEARRTAADMQIEFGLASDAAHRAVLADTDERAVSAAAEVRRAFGTLEKRSDDLAPLLEQLGYAEESTLLQQFKVRLAEYRALEENILNLAVEGTNAKAHQLSVGPAQEAVDALSQSLGALAPLRASDAWHVKALSASALANVREIQVLHAPHIAEASEAAMTDLETRMTASAAAATDALTELRSLVTPASRPHLATAVGALERFMKVNTNLVVLSRRNTNVRSLAMSLDQKRTLIAPCQQSLVALREALEKRRHVGRRWP